jgi:hypothetical protein
MVIPEKTLKVIKGYMKGVLDKNQKERDHELG